MPLSFWKADALAAFAVVEGGALNSLNQGRTTMKLATIALASAFALSSTFALAYTKHHKSGARTHHSYARTQPAMNYGGSNFGWNNSGWNSPGWNNPGWNNYGGSSYGWSRGGGGPNDVRCCPLRHFAIVQQLRPPRRKADLTEVLSTLASENDVRSRPAREPG